jgi:hypothetical protein
MSGDGEDMYNVGIGHAMHGTKPDKIANRPKSYKWYVRTLVITLGGDASKFDFSVFDYITKSGHTTEENATIFRLEYNMITHDFSKGAFMMYDLNQAQKDFLDSRKFSEDSEVKIEARVRATCVDECNDTWEEETYYNLTTTKKEVEKQ